jgi:hypothetical protein
VKHGYYLDALSQLEMEEDILTQHKAEIVSYGTEREQIMFLKNNPFPDGVDYLKESRFAIRREIIFEYLLRHPF